MKSPNKNKYKHELSPLLFKQKTITKNSSYYQKIYSTVSDSFKLNDEEKPIKKNKKTKSFSKNLEAVFRKPKKFNNDKEKWEKLTIPSLPFSERKIESKETRQKKILLKKPDQKYHNYEMIKWLHLKYSDYVKQKSIYSLLFNENDPNIKSDYKPKGDEEYVFINPKYFYDDSTYNKILQLKEIFVKFYNNSNHKMDISGIINMFKKNNIHVNFQEIKNLFFKNSRNIKNKNEIMMDFYEFLNFALSKDQDFRKFMRKIKKKYENKKTDGKVFLPMNLELVFDYFIGKEKERSSIEIVENAIKEMDEVINGVKFEKEEYNSKNFAIKKNLFNTERYKSSVNLKKLKLFEQKKKSDSSIKEKEKDKDKDEKNKSTSNMKQINSSPTVNNKKPLNIEIDNEILDNINFDQLINEFSNLFTSKETNINNFERKIDKNYNINSLLDDKSNNKRNLSVKRKNKTISAINEIKRKLKINELREMNINNYKKYGDLKMTLYATKNQVNGMKNKNIDKNGLFELVELKNFDGSKYFSERERNKSNENYSRPFSSTSKYKCNKYYNIDSCHKEYYYNLSTATKENDKNKIKMCSSQRVRNNNPKIKKKYDYVPYELFL